MGAFRMISGASTPVGKDGELHPSEGNTLADLKCPEWSYFSRDLWCDGVKNDSPLHSFQQFGSKHQLHQGWRLLAAPAPSIWCSCRIPGRRWHDNVTISFTTGHCSLSPCNIFSKTTLCLWTSGTRYGTPPTSVIRGFPHKPTVWWQRWHQEKHATNQVGLQCSTHANIYI